MQKNNAAVGTNYSHIFSKRGDDVSPRLTQASIAGLAPTDAELDAAFGQTAAQINTVLDPFVGILDAGGAGTDVFLVIATNGAWFYGAVALAV